MRDVVFCITSQCKVGKETCFSQKELSAASGVVIAYLKPNMVLGSPKKDVRASSFQIIYELVGKKGLGH